jgi:hypothetical protein
VYICSLGRFSINYGVNGEEDSDVNYFNLGLQFNTTQIVRMDKTEKHEEIRLDM